MTPYTTASRSQSPSASSTQGGCNAADLDGARLRADNTLRVNPALAEESLRSARAWCDEERFTTAEGCAVKRATLLDTRVRDVGELVILSCPVDLFQHNTPGETP